MSKKKLFIPIFLVLFSCSSIYIFYLKHQFAKLLTATISPSLFVNDLRISAEILDSSDKVFSCIAYYQDTSEPTLESPVINCSKAFSIFKFSLTIRPSLDSPAIGEITFFFNYKDFIVPLLLSLVLTSFTQLLVTKYNAQKIRADKLKIHTDILEGLSKQLKHDIASPLGALSTLRTLKDAKVSEVSDFISQIESRIKNIASSLTEAKKIDLTYPFNFSNAKVTINEIDALINDLIKEKNLEHPDLKLAFNFSTQKELNKSVLIDKGHLARAISNILNNSARALQGKDNPTININLAGTTNTLKIEISDNGVGAKPEILKLIGSKEYQNNIERSGNGLGLYHAKSLIKSCGGDITFKSQLNSGFTTLISIPYK